MTTAAQRAQVERFLRFRYPVLLRELASEDGGGYLATIPQLGSGTFTAVGETAEEALAALDELRKYLIPRLIERGADLPEPQDDETAIEQYSGNVNLRLTPSLHAQLAADAKQNKTSINKLCTQLLSQQLERRWALQEMRSMFDELRETIEHREHRLSQQITVHAHFTHGGSLPSDARFRITQPQLGDRWRGRAYGDYVTEGGVSLGWGHGRTT